MQNHLSNYSDNGVSDGGTINAGKIQAQKTPTNTSYPQVGVPHGTSSSMPIEISNDMPIRFPNSNPNSGLIGIPRVIPNDLPSNLSSNSPNAALHNYQMGLQNISNYAPNNLQCTSQIPSFTQHGNQNIIPNGIQTGLTNINGTYMPNQAQLNGNYYNSQMSVRNIDTSSHGPQIPNEIYFQGPIPYEMQGGLNKLNYSHEQDMSNVLTNNNLNQEIFQPMLQMRNPHFYPRNSNAGIRNGQFESQTHERSLPPIQNDNANDSSQHSMKVRNEDQSIELPNESKQISTSENPTYQSRSDHNLRTKTESHSPLSSLDTQSMVFPQFMDHGMNHQSYYIPEGQSQHYSSSGSSHQQFQQHQPIPNYYSNRYQPHIPNQQSIYFQQNSAFIDSNIGETHVEMKKVMEHRETTNHENLPTESRNITSATKENAQILGFEQNGFHNEPTVYGPIDGQTLHNNDDDFSDGSDEYGEFQSAENDPTFFEEEKIEDSVEKTSEDKNSGSILLTEHLFDEISQLDQNSTDIEASSTIKSHKESKTVKNEIIDQKGKKTFDPMAFLNTLDFGESNGPTPIHTVNETAAMLDHFESEEEWGDFQEPIDTSQILNVYPSLEEDSNPMDSLKFPLVDETKKSEMMLDTKILSTTDLENHINSTRENTSVSPLSLQSKASNNVEKIVGINIEVNHIDEQDEFSDGDWEGGFEEEVKISEVIASKPSIEQENNLKPNAPKLSILDLFDSIEPTHPIANKNEASLSTDVNTKEETIEQDFDFDSNSDDQWGDFQGAIEQSESELNLVNEEIVNNPIDEITKESSELGPTKSELIMIFDNLLSAGRYTEAIECYNLIQGDDTLLDSKKEKLSEWTEEKAQLSSLHLKILLGFYCDERIFEHFCGTHSKFLRSIPLNYSIIKSKDQLVELESLSKSWEEESLKMLLIYAPSVRLLYTTLEEVSRYLHIYRKGINLSEGQKHELFNHPKFLNYSQNIIEIDYIMQFLLKSIIEECGLTAKDVIDHLVQVQNNYHLKLENELFVNLNLQWKSLPNHSKPLNFSTCKITGFTHENPEYFCHFGGQQLWVKAANLWKQLVSEKAPPKRVK